MNNECGFLFWFIRPFAEIAAGLSVLFVMAAFFIGYVFYVDWKTKRKTK